MVDYYLQNTSGFVWSLYSVMYDLETYEKSPGFARDSDEHKTFLDKVADSQHIFIDAVVKYNAPNVSIEMQRALYFDYSRVTQFMHQVNSASSECKKLNKDDASYALKYEASKQADEAFSNAESDFIEKCKHYTGR